MGGILIGYGTRGGAGDGCKLWLGWSLLILRLRPLVANDLLVVCLVLVGGILGEVGVVLHAVT